MAHMEETMKRRILIALAAALAASVAVPAIAQDKPYAGTRLSVLMEGHPTTDGIQALLPEFTAETGIEVELEIVPESDVSPKILLEFSSGSGRYDVVQNNIIFVPGYVQAGYIEPLDQMANQWGQYFDRADFVPGYLGPNVIDGALYGLPVFGESTLLMYRKDLFEEYGIAVPTSFSDIEAAAKTIEEKSNGEIAGITMRGAQGIHSVYVWAGWLWGFGGEFINADGGSALGTPEAAAALEAYARVLRDYGPVGVANFGWEENRILFQQGKAGITLDATVNGAFNEDRRSRPSSVRSATRRSRSKPQRARAAPRRWARTASILPPPRPTRKPPGSSSLGRRPSSSRSSHWRLRPIPA
jgi:multiple sugar transport system substrate-binding protein